MKVAQIQVETITLTCPSCGDALDGPHSGSTMWDWTDIDTADRESRGTVWCAGCEKNVKIPSRARKMIEK